MNLFLFAIAAWSHLVNCESSHTNVPPSGYFQIIPSTWQGYEPGVASDYPALTQWSVARAIYRARGSEPWPVCGRYLAGVPRP